MERGTFHAAEQAAKQGDPVAAYGLMRQTLIENPTHVPMLAASVAAQQSLPVRRTLPNQFCSSVACERFPALACHSHFVGAAEAWSLGRSSRYSAL